VETKALEKTRNHDLGSTAGKIIKNLLVCNIFIYTIQKSLITIAKCSKMLFKNFFFLNVYSWPS